MKSTLVSFGMFTCFLAACQTMPLTQMPSALPDATGVSALPAEIEVSHEGHTLSEQEMPDFIIQQAQGSRASNLLVALTKLAKEWYQKPRNPDCKRTPELLITDVQLAVTGMSILGKGAPGALAPDYAGKSIELILKGTFKDNGKPLQIKSFRFTLEPSLVQQTFVGNDPPSRVLLDDSILLEPLAVSGTEIRVRLNTQGVPDLYLKGLHKITLEQGDWYTDGLIQVSDPAPVQNLQPRIDSVELLPAKGKPEHLLLHGANFMVFPKLSYATIDGAFGFGFQTEVSDEGAADTIVHIPDSKTFNPKAHHTVVYSTVFGVAFKEF